MCPNQLYWMVHECFILLPLIIANFVMKCIMNNNDFKLIINKGGREVKIVKLQCLGVGRLY